MPRGRPRLTEKQLFTRNTWRPDRHGPRPVRQDAPSAIWDEFLALPDTPKTDARLTQEERESVALEQMGWKLPG